MTATEINAKELAELIEKNRSGLEIIDIRQPGEYDIISLKYSKLIPTSELQRRFNEIDFNKEVIFICHSGSRSKLASFFIAKQTGHEIKNLKGGIVDLYNSKMFDLLEIKGNEDQVKKYI